MGASSKNLVHVMAADALAQGVAMSSATMVSAI